MKNMVSERACPGPACFVKTGQVIRLLLIITLCALIALTAFGAVKKSSLSEAASMEEFKNRKAKITNCDVDSQLSYNNLVMLTLHISFPRVSLQDPSVQGFINEYYQSESVKFNARASGVLFDQAIEEYIQATANGFPYRTFDAFMNYSVKLNSNCTLSSFFDKYEYTGGAHGSTLRTSVTFDLQTGRKIRMQDLFRPGQNWRRLVLEQILLIADSRMSSEPVYFENYRELIVKNFNENNFYLTPAVVVVYYQQYEIGPYAIGLPEFEIPYSNLGIQSPSCG